MAAVARKLDLTVGELVEIDGKRYEVVSDRNGDLTLEPPVTPIAELDRADGTEAASPEEFERLTEAMPSDDEG